MAACRRSLNGVPFCLREPGPSVCLIMYFAWTSPFASAWAQALEMALPEEMLVGLEEFTRFHDQNSNKTRKLTWQVRSPPSPPASLASVLFLKFFVAGSTVASLDSIKHACAGRRRNVSLLQLFLVTMCSFAPISHCICAAGMCRRLRVAPCPGCPSLSPYLNAPICLPSCTPPAPASPAPPACTHAECRPRICRRCCSCLWARYM
jgi:hypothetical protein